MKFVDYESSHITPQMTLLKKFNEVLKFLRDKKESYISFYLHTITLDNDEIIYLIDMDETEIETLEDLYNHYKNSISCKIDISSDANHLHCFSDIVKMLYVSSGTPQLFTCYMNRQTLTFVNRGTFLQSDVVEEL